MQCQASPSHFHHLGQCRNVELNFLMESDSTTWSALYGAPVTAACSKVLYTDLLQEARYVSSPTCCTLSCHGLLDVALHINSSSPASDSRHALCRCLLPDTEGDASVVLTAQLRSAIELADQEVSLPHVHQLYGSVMSVNPSSVPPVSCASVKTYTVRLCGSC